MLANLLTVFLAAGAIAAPLTKREDVMVTTVIEHDLYDPEGHLINKQFEVGKPVLQQVAPKQAPAPAPAPPAPQPVAAIQAPADPPKADPPKTQGASAVLPKGGPVSNVNAGGASSDALFVGWVEPTDPKFEAISLYHHNVHRANHSADAVTWDADMAAYAQQWAEGCTSEEKVPDGSGYGMSIAFSSTADGYNPSQFISGGWYNSELMNFPQYGVGGLDVTSKAFMGWGHYSQLVWPDTKKIGCGIAKCPGDGGFGIHAGCVYYPAGNIMGAFDKVKPPTGGPVVYPNGQTHM